jgi:uncharacterized caspase-like protein
MSRVGRSFVLLALTVAFVALVATAASAEARRALIVGINDYREITPLKKAVGDAEALKATLESLGFTVDLVLNADRRELNRAVSAFQSELQPGDTALIHFSGHGVEIDGQNYLLPADVPKPQSGQQDFIKSEAVSLGDLMQRVASSGASTRIFIVDACRDNPFAGTGARGLGGTRGLTKVDAPAGTFVLYSAGYQQSALDRLNDADQEPTSVYTRVLTKKLVEPGKQLAVLAQEVRSEVEELAKTAGHVQRPAYYDELSGKFFFQQAAMEEPAPNPQAATSPPASPPQLPALNEREAFDAAKDIGTDAAWDVFLKRFPQGFYADMARAARDKLARASEPAPAPSSEPAPPQLPSPTGGAAEEGMELNTDRPGFDYRNFDLTAPDAGLCRAQCEAEAQCLSWTYVAPGVQGAYARCWLKKAVPQQTANGCCISGIKRLGQPRVASIDNTRGVASSYWSHNGSGLYLVAEGDRRRFYYETPRPGIGDQGVERGTLLFDGQKIGNNYQGTAYVFVRHCGKFPYAVSGAVAEGSKRVVMYGRAPQPDASCKIGGYRVDTLVFDYLSVGKP